MAKKEDLRHYRAAFVAATVARKHEELMLAWERDGRIKGLPKPTKAQALARAGSMIGLLKRISTGAIKSSAYEVLSEAVLDEEDGVRYYEFMVKYQGNIPKFTMYLSDLEPHVVKKASKPAKVKEIEPEAEAEEIEPEPEAENVETEE